MKLRTCVLGDLLKKISDRSVLAKENWLRITYHSLNGVSSLRASYNATLKIKGYINRNSNLWCGRPSMRIKLNRIAEHMAAACVDEDV